MQLLDLFYQLIAQELTLKLMLKIQKGKDTETIKYGYNKQLDEYIDISKSGKQWIAKLEAKEKERTLFHYVFEYLNPQKQKRKSIRQTKGTEMERQQLP